MTTTDFLSALRLDVGSNWIPEIYEEKVRPLRTRSLELGVPVKENHPQILHTLLGVELKVGKKRIFCPDLSHARYLAVFARLGCSAVAVPYDISVLPSIADQLEAAWHRTRMVFDARSHRSENSKRRLWIAVVGSIRSEIKAIGAGTKMPLFNRSTKQRSN